MRTETINIYTFDELSEEAKQKAIQAHREQDQEIEFFWSGECIDSIKKGLDAFQCDLCNYSIDWQSANRSDFTIRYPDNAEELTGLRLRTWLLNNADRGTITTPKPYGKYEKRANGKWSHDRYSKILKVDSCCPFTGVCYDESFLEPIREFIKNPKEGTTLADLMESACYAVNKDTESEIEYQGTDEAIIETIQANGYEYNAYGKQI